MGLFSTFSLHCNHLLLTLWCKLWQLFTHTCLNRCPPLQQNASVKCGNQDGAHRATAAASGAAAGATGALPTITGACDRKGGRTTRARTSPATNTPVPSSFTCTKIQSQGDEVRADTQEPRALARESHSHVRGPCPYLKDMTDGGGK